MRVARVVESSDQPLGVGLVAPWRGLGCPGCFVGTSRGDERPTGSMIGTSRLVEGCVALVLVTPGCVTRVSTGGGAQAPETSAGHSAPVLGSPTTRLLALREQIARARAAGPLPAERCAAWAAELVALHVEHGEPYVQARLDAAALQHACGRPADARALLEDALPTMPRWARAEASNTLGVLAHEAGDEGAAIAHLQAALHDDPALHDARNNLVRVLLRIYERGGSALARDEIARHLDAWLELAPEDPRIHVQRAALEVVEARRAPAGAAQVRGAARLRLVQVLGRQPPPAVEAEALAVLGRLELDAGDERSALRAFRRAVALDPGCAAAALGGAALMLVLRDFAGALEQLEAAAGSVDPADERTRLRLLAVALRGVQRFDEAGEVYARLLAVAEPEPVDLYNRAQLDLYVLEHTEQLERAQLERVHARLREVVGLAREDPRHAELERRARASLAAFEFEWMHDDTQDPKALEAEALEMEREERRRWPAERKRLLELEAKARAARERERERGASR